MGSAKHQTSPGAVPNRRRNVGGLSVFAMSKTESYISQTGLTHNGVMTGTMHLMSITQDSRMKETKITVTQMVCCAFSLMSLLFIYQSRKMGT